MASFLSAAVSAESGLSYFGFGVQPPDVSLGTLIANGASSVTRFRGRCHRFTALPEAEQVRCVEEDPLLHPIRAGHGAACHYAEETDIIDTEDP